MNINDDGRHLSKQRQVSFLIYGNFDRFEISFFAMIVFAWRYALAPIHGATVQTCNELVRRKKKYFGKCASLPDSMPEVESLWMLILVHTKTDFTKWKILHKNGVQCYNIDIRFSIISFYNVSKSKIHYSLFTVHLNIWTEFKINLLGILENF